MMDIIPPYFIWARRFCRDVSAGAPVKYYRATEKRVNKITEPVRFTVPAWILRGLEKGDYSSVWLSSNHSRYFNTYYGRKAKKILSPRIYSYICETAGIEGQ